MSRLRQTHGDPSARHAWKIRLVRGLYERGFSPKDVRELFHVIDWLMELPPPLRDVFWEDLDKIQEERRMPFISTPERELRLVDGIPHDQRKQSFQVGIDGTGHHVRTAPVRRPKRCTAA